jgi:outer membrane protein OmpA-like peptidoglycan-associated protein
MTFYRLHKIMFRIQIFLLLALFSLSAPASPEGEKPVLESARIVDALKPKPKTKTRSLRNLRVEPAPSVSLTIAFEFDSAQVTKDSAEQLEELASALTSEELNTLDFLIEGHTDAKGPLSYNMKLSERRAQAVREFLIQRGVRDHALRARGLGPTDLADPEQPLSAMNRRVKVVTLDVD